MSYRRQMILLISTVVIIVGTFAWTLASDSRPALGLDLQGGISIVLFPVEGTDTSSLDTAVDIIRQRVDGLGIAEPEVTRQGNTIVVDLPGVDEREKAEEQVGQTAELRFRPVQAELPWATPIPTTTTTVPGQTPTTVAGAPTTVAGAPTSAPPAVDGSTSTTISGSGAGARTIPTAPIAATRPAQETTVAPDTTPTTVAGATPTTVPGATTPLTVAQPQPGQSCTDLLTPREANVPEAEVWLPGRPVDGGDPASCFLLGPTILTGRNISKAEARYDTNTASYVTDITFKNDDFVEKVAGPYVNQRVAIELDGVVQSAPTINEGITGRNVQISGAFSKGEATDLARLLRYGALPVQFDRDEQTVQSISPTLGKDQLHAGIVAGIIGLALVAIYMLAYYRLLGLVVVCGLALTGLLFFTLTSFLSTRQGLALTLAGVTGLIVSVGVTVDSYVVYFERLKDEIRSGKTVRSSLDVGFRRAFRTILAADLVSLLGAAVLYYLASGSVRGFAFFLGLSTLIDLVLTATFMHPFVSLLSRRPNLVRVPKVGIAAGLDVPEVRGVSRNGGATKELPALAAVADDGEIPGFTRRHKFADLYHEHTNFQFIKHSRRWLILSSILVLVSVGALFFKELNLGIEFEGGTAWQVTMADGKNASTQDVRDLLEPLGFADAKVSTLAGQGNESVRVQAEVVEDPIRTIQVTLADATNLEPADVQFVRNEDGSGTFTFAVPKNSTVTQESVQKAMTDSNQPDAVVTVDGQNYTVQVPTLPTSPVQDVAVALAKYAGVDVNEVSVSTVGPTWGETVSRKALQALIIFFILLALYLSFRFEWKMSATAIVAVIHDIIVSVGVYALFQFEVTPATVTAFLTILGFSLYDTVVVYDKIRENQKTLTSTGKATYPEMVNRSLNAVLMRSLSTTIVALLPVLSLLIVGSLILGATALEEFALALAVGLAIGSYSSIFVAAPLLAHWKAREPQYHALNERRKRTSLAAASVSTGIPVVEDPADDEEPRAHAASEGIPGPAAVGRTTTARTAAPRPRQQRRRKRK